MGAGIIRLELGEELLTYWFLAFLAAIWIAFFLPGAVRARRRTPLPAATRFKQVMAFIAPPKPRPRHAARRARTPEPETSSDGRWIVVPHASERVKKREALRRAQARRRRIFGALVFVAVSTAVAALALRGIWLELHLIADGILVFYVAMLFETKKRQDERAAKVHHIAAPAEPDVIVLDDARVGGGPL